MERGAPDFSGIAKMYAEARPTYPDALYDWICTQLESHRLAWDTATGSGQAALGLAPRFDCVAASDISLAQVSEAVRHPNVHYFVGRAETSPLRDDSVDLVVAAAAAHWFDLDRFGTEVERVAHPGTLLAAWTYHVGHVRGPLSEAFVNLLREVRDYFGSGANLVDARYETLPLPGTRIDAPPFEIEVQWTRDQATGFARSWSGVQKYIEETGIDPIQHFQRALDDLWPPEERASIVWPIYVWASRF